MLYAILGLVDPGDEVLVPDPGYPIYESLTRFVGATPVPDPDPDGERLPARRRRAGRADHAADPAAGHQLAGQPDRRRPHPRRPRARSPTLAIEHDLWVLADEIYGRILYDGAEHVSIASLPGMAERTIVLDGFSKTYAMTGWRMGYAIVPEALVRTYSQLIINTDQRRRDVRPGRRGRGAHRAAGRRRRDGRRVPGAARPDRRRPQRHPRASSAACRVARSTSSRTSPGPGCPARSSPSGCSRRPASASCRARRSGGRRRPHPDLVRQLAGRT